MENDFDRAVQKQLDAAMPWVGLYIAAASAVCTLAMAADAFNGVRRKKLWIPCKYTSLNAASLTALAVAMKLPMDLNTVMIKSQTDAIAKYTSLVFMSTAVNYCMPSLGSMSNDKEVVANVAGLAILAITITANVGIQMIELQGFLTPATVYAEIIIPTVLMLLSLVTLVSMAFSISNMKRSLKRMYMEKHRAAIDEEGIGSSSSFTTVDQNQRRDVMMKYWVMAESSSPQFVIARSSVCTCSSLICSFSFIVITTFHILDGTSTHARGQSPYGIYTGWIVILQSTGEFIAVTVAILRWFVSVSVVSNTTFQLHLKIEAYWIQSLEDWRNGQTGFQIGPNRWAKCIVDVKWCVLSLCIGIQSVIIHLSKTLVFFSSLVISPFIFCFSRIKHTSGGGGGGGGGDDDDMEAGDLSRYVLLLEGEAELPARFVRSMCLEADRMIQKGRENKPSSLINLLHKSTVNFNGVGRYNNTRIPSLLSQEPPDCWMLPLVTLTTIAIALSNSSDHQRKQLLSSVSEGLSLVKIIEKTLDTRAHLKNIRKVASVTWVQVLLYSKWLGINLMIRECKSSLEVLQDLSDKAEATVMEWKSEVQDSDMSDISLNWPSSVVAANSMYRICQTILLEESGGEELWERLCVMIADILAACFTNLPPAIIKMCLQNSIDKREKCVREAFLLLGKTEQVVEFVQQQQRPSMDDGKEAYIEEWRAYFLQQEKDDETMSSSPWSDESRRSENQLAIEVL